jgi:branched-chain amino acid transport system permease protein
MLTMFSSTLLGQVFVNGMSLSAIYILVALGFTLLFGTMRIVNFAHGAFAMLGGFAIYYLLARGICHISSQRHSQRSR